MSLIVASTIKNRLDIAIDSGCSKVFETGEIRIGRFGCSSDPHIGEVMEFQSIVAFTVAEMCTKSLARIC